MTGGTVHRLDRATPPVSGDSVVRRITGSRGSPLVPLSDDEVRGKARGLLAGRLPAADVGTYVDRFDHLVHEPSTDWVFDSFPAT